MYEIKNINPVSLGKSLAVIAGSVYFAIFSIFMLFMMGIGEVDIDDLFDDDIFLVLLIGIVVSVVGVFVGGVVGAFVYNKYSERFGGVKMDIAYHDNSQKQNQKNQTNSV